MSCKKYHCEHGRQKYRCRDCGGSSLCVHGRHKSHCRDCGGISFCVHNRQKSHCRDCGGSSFCVHNRRKSHCRDCGGSSFCVHNRRKSHCRDCGDVIKKTIDRFIKDSKNSDKKYNRLDIVNFIDRDFCKLLIEESNNKCCYCECELELIINCPNLISIERINNEIGHIKSNVKISCNHCNVSKVGSQIAML